MKSMQRCSPWRRTSGGRNGTYTDWQKDNYFHAIRGLTGRVKRLGIEFDHITIDTLNLLKSEFPQMEFVDITTATMVREIARVLRHSRSGQEIAGSRCQVQRCSQGTERDVCRRGAAAIPQLRLWPGSLDRERQGLI